MARPREFDEQVALERAMEAFWDEGYAGTSTQVLCEATGLGRSSIYNTFSSKRALFLRSLQLYCDTHTQARIDLLAGPGAPKDKLRRLLFDTIEQELTMDHRGCFTVNTIHELGTRDPEISALLIRDTDRYIDAMAATIRAGQRTGEIGEGHDAVSMAKFLHSQLGGLRLRARGGADREALTVIAELALSVL